uniref:Chemokine interleukin-8-like domain-containing protein n=1 Tax=Astyanax mexicanus TaxID=7994 RepID=A0A3B1IIN6_ASTMX
MFNSCYCCLQVLILLVLFTLCITLFYNKVCLLHPLRCQCIKYSSKASPWSRIVEFSVTQPHSRCQTTEVVITLKTINSATGKNHQRCLDLKLSQTAILQECWNRINKDASKSVLKFSECGQRE